MAYEIIPIQLGRFSSDIPLYTWICIDLQVRAVELLGGALLSQLGSFPEVLGVVKILGFATRTDADGKSEPIFFVLPNGGEKWR